MNKEDARYTKKYVIYAPVQTMDKYLWEKYTELWFKLMQSRSNRFMQRVINDTKNIMKKKQKTTLGLSIVIDNNRAGHFL